MTTTTQLAHIPDHAEQARKALAWPLRSKPRAAALAEALGGACQPWEDFLLGLLTGGTLANATGVLLDQWGDLVGEPRGVLLADDDYRPFVEARILANRSSGTVNELLRIVRLVTAPTLKIEYVPLSVAGFAISVYRQDWMTDVRRQRARRLLADITPAGVTGEWYEAVAGNWGPSPAPYTTPSGVPARRI